jgi:protease I
MNLQGKRVALLVEDEYQELEFWYPNLRLREAGATVVVVGSGRKGSFDSKLGYPAEVDKAAHEVQADDFDAVIVPGGFAPDYMRLSKPMVDLVRGANERNKLVAAICHGGWMLVSAGALRGRRATGYDPIRDDVENAGGSWVDAEVVRDGNVITSRTPPDLPAFLSAIIQYLSEAPTTKERPATKTRASAAPSMSTAAEYL